MKKMVHALTGALILMTPLVWGSLLFYGNGVNTAARDFLHQMMVSSPLYGAGLGLALLLVVLIYLVTWGSPRARPRYISFESESGSVSISIGAVRDFVQKVGDEFGAVVSMDPKIRTGKNGIRIDLDVRIQTGSRLPELSQMLQGRVRETIRDGLGIVDVREVQVNVQEIVGVPSTAPVKE